MALRDETDPRIERSRQCILMATADLLRDVGYGSLTMEAVAARSGVAKSTIYRHWSTKAELVADAFTRVDHVDHAVIPPPGPVRDRVVAVLVDLVRSFAADEQRLSCIMPALIDAAERSDDIAQLTAKLSAERAATLVAVLDEAVRAGELPARTDTQVLGDALLGPVLLRRLFHRPAVDEADVPALVDQILCLGTERSPEM